MADPPEPKRRVPIVYEPTAGELFAGRYRIESLLGRGAAGAVWAATDEAVGDRLALKLLTAGPGDAAERFRREVRLARRVTHQNAVRIFDLGTVDGVLYLTMELIDGESLLETLEREGRIAVAQVLDIGRQIATGLHAAHAVSVVHRDIKPANVLLEVGGRVVLTDFGVARAVASDPQLTVGSAMIGTPSYMAPEQIEGGTVSPATDLYALGALLYEMATGRCPFVEDSAVATAVARLHRPPEDPRTHASLPDQLAALILELLELAPEDRPTGAEYVAALLGELEAKASDPDAAETFIAVESQVGDRGVSARTGAATGSDAGGTFVSIAPENRTLAVLPFRHRGPSEHSYLSESLAEDLVDIFTATRGLRVTASGATAKYHGQTVDPREAGRELGADAIVDGSVRIAGTKVTVSARLIDVQPGEQLWADRFDLALDDAVSDPDVTAQRIAEQLRRELELLSARHQAPAQAIELLIRARERSLSGEIADDAFTEAMKLLDEAIALAPSFALAIATHAEFAVRRWFLPSRGSDEDFARAAHESVARALLEAAEIPLSHFAAGRLAVSDGRFSDAASELGLALRMAPTFAAVYDYLGMLQCEAGRADEGERNIVLAQRIDPSLPVRPELARRRALANQLDEYRELIEEMRATPSASRFMVDSIEMRVAGWYGDVEGVKRCRPASLLPPESEFLDFMLAQQACLIGEGTPEDLVRNLERVLGSGGPRLDAFIRQLTIEALAPAGATEEAMAQLHVAVAKPAFVDADWMERCPALESLRSHEDFGGLSDEVRRRADAIWSVRAS